LVNFNPDFLPIFTSPSMASYQQHKSDFAWVWNNLCFTLAQRMQIRLELVLLEEAIVWKNWNMKKEGKGLYAD
jgi:hypothetical protein